MDVRGSCSNTKKKLRCVALRVQVPTDRQTDRTRHQTSSFLPSFSPGDWTSGKGDQGGSIHSANVEATHPAAGSIGPSPPRPKYRWRKKKKNTYAPRRVKSWRCRKFLPCSRREVHPGIADLHVSIITTTTTTPRRR